MSAKRLFLLFIILVLLCCGCQKDIYASQQGDIYFGIEYRNDLTLVFIKDPTGHSRISLTNEDVKPEDLAQNREYDDPNLQKAVRKQIRRISLNNDSAISAYAWNLQPILQELSYMPNDFFPVRVISYSNGIHIIYDNDSYIEFIENIEDHIGEYSDTSVEVYVSATTGHIIDIISPYA